MIDIHCHILPDVDDGARHYTDSLSMAKQAESEGISTIIATPHHQNGSYLNPKEEILTRVADLNDYLKSERVNVEILPGQETRIYGELLEDYENGEILPLAQTSNYLFVELPSAHVPRYTEQLCFDIQMKGLIPVIVHPERNSELLDHPDKLYKLVKSGAATQITAASAAGYFGKKIQKFTLDIVEANLTHFIASDAHNTTTRGFKMNAGLDEIEKKFGNDMVYMLLDNSDFIVAGKDIFREVPNPIKKKKLFGIF